MPAQLSRGIASTHTHAGASSALSQPVQLRIAVMMQGSMARSLSNCWSSCSLRCAPQRNATRSRRLTHTVKAIGWDPEGILSAPVGNHIQRRTFQKQVEQDKDLAAKVEAEQQRLREELIQKRESRVLPTTPQQAVEYFLDTEGSEMEFEVARCRPMLTKDFFQFLEREITSERLAATPNEDRLAELSILQQYLEEVVEAVDKATSTIAAPAERLRTLLMSKDKAATLYEMAGNNEIDQDLIKLLEQNIAGAQAAGNEDAVTFLTKIANAARKFVMTSV